MPEFPDKATETLHVLKVFGHEMIHRQFGAEYCGNVGVTLAAMGVLTGVRYALNYPKQAVKLLEGMRGAAAASEAPDGAFGSMYGNFYSDVLAGHVEALVGNLPPAPGELLDRLREARKTYRPPEVVMKKPEWWPWEENPNAFGRS